MKYVTHKTLTVSHENDVYRGPLVSQICTLGLCTKKDKFFSGVSLIRNSPTVRLKTKCITKAELALLQDVRAQE